MDYLNINRQLLEQLAEITASMERITKGEAVHPLDKDLLLNKIRDLYSTALKIGTMADETKVTEPSPVVEQDEPHTLTPEELQALNKAKEGVEKQEAEKEPESENIDYESYMDVHEPFDEPEPEPVPSPIVEPELPLDEEPEITPEPEMKEEPKLYGPIPEEFKEIETQDSFEEETPEPEPEPAAEIEPEPAPKPEPDTVTNRKNAIEDLVAQSQTPKVEEPEPPQTEPEPQPEQPSHKGQQPQLSLLDYLSGVSHVVENIGNQAPNPTKTVADKIVEKQQTSTLNNPEPAPSPATTQKFADFRTIIGINDKFTYINDLFEKDMRSYNEFINTLNKIEDLDEAQNFVQETATKYGWNKESMAVQLFMSAYKRRYSATLNLE